MQTMAKDALQTTETLKEKEPDALQNLINESEKYAIDFALNSVAYKTTTFKAFQLQLPIKTKDIQSIVVAAEKSRIVITTIESGGVNVYSVDNNCEVENVTETTITLKTIVNNAICIIVLKNLKPNVKQGQIVNIKTKIGTTITKQLNITLGNNEKPTDITRYFQIPINKAKTQSKVK
jgi:hypothetical protein